MKTRVLFVLLLAIAGWRGASAQPVDKDKLDGYFDRLSEKDKAMGSMTITRDGVISYTRAIGFGEITGSEVKPLTAFSRFRIGSVSKMFTATMILQLVEEGKLKLTDTLDGYFPRVPNATKITIEQMLAHRSGISDLTEDPEFRNWKVEPKSRDDVVARISGRAPEFEPDAKFGYSNSGYILLGYIIEQATGMVYQEALKARITSKIRLADTYLGTGKIDFSLKEVESYRYGTGWNPEPQTHLSVPGGAGAIISTPADLAKFIQALFDLQLVTKASLDRMTQGELGMQRYSIDGQTLYGHGGAIDGFRALLLYLPNEKLAIAYTTNGMRYPIAQIVEDALAIARSRPFQIPIFESVSVATDVLDLYVGEYSSPNMPVTFTISRTGTVLTAQPEGKSAAQLEATARDAFKCEPMGLVIEFDAAKKQMTLKRRGRETVFTKK